jgi:hypothetical protein
VPPNRPICERLRNPWCHASTFLDANWTGNHSRHRFAPSLYQWVVPLLRASSSFTERVFDARQPSPVLNLIHHACEPRQYRKMFPGFTNLLAIVASPMYRREAVQDFLEVRLGVTTPRWRITGDSNAVCFFDCTKSPSLLVALDPKQATQIRSLSPRITLTLNISHEKYLVYMSGQRVGQCTWEGIASGYADPSFSAAAKLTSLFRKCRVWAGNISQWARGRGRSIHPTQVTGWAHQARSGRSQPSPAD